MIYEQWVLALVAVGAGLVIGAICGAMVRRSLSRKSRRTAVREVARPASVFVFWLSTSAGVVAAMAMTNPETLEPIPSEMFRWLPNVLAAGLIVLVGYALGVVVSGSLSRGFRQATGRRSQLAERTLRAAIMIGAVVLALGQLGVEITILIVLTAGAVAAVALAFGLLAGLGGRTVAASIAAGRALRPELAEGHSVVLDGELHEIIHLGAANATLRREADEAHVVVSYSYLFDRPLEIHRPITSDPDDASSDQC